MSGASIDLHDGEGERFGYVLSVSQPYKSGNVTYANGEPLLGREYIIFVEEDEE